MFEFFHHLFDTSDFPARWHCGNWSNGHGWLHITSDLAIWGAYMAIPAILSFFILRRKDTPFLPIFWLFAAFIFFCGTTHLLDAGLFWWPAYRLSGAVKLLTALVSWATVFALIPVLPRALALPMLGAANAELNQALRASTQSEERLRLVIEAAPGGMVMVDSDGIIVLTNTANDQIFGYGPGELVGQQIEILVPPGLREAHPGYRDAFRIAPEARPMGRGRDLYGRRKDGSEVAVEIGLNPLTTAGGPLILASVVDITGRKRAEDSLSRANAALEAEIEVRKHTEAALRESIERVQLYSAVVESSEDAIITRNLEGNITAWNPAAERLYGYSAGEAVGAPLTLIVPEPRRTELDDVMERARDGSSIKPFRTEQRHRSGRLINVFVTISHVRAESGAIIGTSLIARDITGQLAIEEKFRLAVESAPNGIVMVDRRGRIELVNRETERLFGYGREALLGQSVEMLVPDQFRGTHPEMREAYHAAPLERRMGEGRDLFGLRSDGIEFPIEVGLNPIHTPEGMLVLGVIVDITERKRAEARILNYTEELKRSNEELETFAYVASHDLQEPLRMVASYVELLGKRYEGRLDEKADKYIFYAVDGARRMKQLINDLLSYSRVNTSGKPFEVTDAEAVVARVVRSLEVRIRETGANVTWGPLPHVLSDPIQLGQVFQNLIGNGIKFHGAAAPLVHVGAEVRDSLCVFSVADNGIGIETKYAERVFQLFQRLNTRDEYEGTGIGLTVARKVVERHGGRIWFESAPGAGTTFYFTIPAAG